MKIFETEKQNMYGYIPDDYLEDIRSIIVRRFEPTIMTLNDNYKVSSCINCPNVPCMSYNESEVGNKTQLKGMPYNNNRNVCPTNAILISEEYGISRPFIDQTKCISCGLCLSRCPAGAIYFHNGVAEVGYSSDIISWTHNIDAVHNTLEFFSHKEKIIDVAEIPNTFFHTLKRNITPCVKKDNNFENILIRNLLIQNGIPAVIRAIGNNDIRFDLIASIQDKTIVGDIALKASELLDCPRNMLDAIAVLVGRYSLSYDSLLPCIFLLEFPNKRSEYYEIIDDIREVLNINIKTIPVFILLLINLFGKSISLDSINDNFNISKLNYSSLQTLFNLLDIRSLDIEEQYLSFFKATK